MPSVCATCLEVNLQSCPDFLYVKGGFSANTEYFWCLTNKFGKIYQRLVTTDGDGKLTIDCSFLPDGALNAYAGAFKLQIRDGSNYLTIIPLSLNDEEFDCIMLSFVDTEGDEGINNLIEVQPAEDGSTQSNFTDFTFDDETGEAEFTGADAGDVYTNVALFKSPYDGTGYINGEGIAPSNSPFTGLSTFLSYLTPDKPVVVRWRRQGGAPGFIPLSAWDEKTVTVTRLAKRWYRLWRFVGEQAYEIAPGFSGLKVYNIEGDLIGSYDTIEDLIAAWNADPVNVNFQILGSRTTSGFYEVQLDPDASEIHYPIQYVTVGY